PTIISTRPKVPESPRRTPVPAGSRRSGPHPPSGSPRRGSDAASRGRPALPDRRMPSSRSPARGRVPGEEEPAMPELIVVDPKIMGGKPVIAGTRITVEYILGQLGHGHS